MQSLQCKRWPCRRYHRMRLSLAHGTAAVLFVVNGLSVTMATDSVTDSPPLELPRLSVEDFRYAGAFRLPSGNYGASSVSYSQGSIAFNPSRQSLYIVGHSHQQAIAEFPIPRMINSAVPAELDIAGAPIQPFSRVLDRVSGGNPERNNRIGGMLYVNGPDGPELLVNAYMYYNAAGKNKTSMLVVRDAHHLAKSDVDGFFEVQGRPGHTAGWMTPIPEPWGRILGGEYLTGTSSGIPIISRCSVGPSAFVFNPLDVVGRKSVTSLVPTIRLLDFSNRRRLHKDLSNKSLQNHLWTHTSRAVFGVVIPGTRTYATFGSSGGHASGIGYKIVQDNGKQSGGYSSFAVKDNYHYYWLWDVSDLVRVRAGEILPHRVRPYEYGIFQTPFADLSNRLGGGTFDPTTDRIYLTALFADRTQGRYKKLPVVMVWKTVIPER